MTDRVTHSTVEFAGPFLLDGFDEPLPPGLYHLVTEHEAFDVAGHTVHRRMATVLRVERQGRIEHHTIDPASLERALKQDAEKLVCLPGPVADMDNPASPPGLLVTSPWRSIPKWVRSNPFRFKG